MIDCVDDRVVDGALLSFVGDRVVVSVLLMTCFDRVVVIALSMIVGVDDRAVAIVLDHIVNMYF